MTENNIILQVDNISKNYKQIHAVDNLSFQLQKGKVYGLLGPNGSGKSTTLGIILGVINQNKGSYTWFENKVTHQEALKKIGAILEKPCFYPYMTGYDNLKLVCKIKNINYSEIEDKLRLVGLLDRKDSKFKTYSFGMKQRLAIASSMLNNPSLLILDEPTNGLDPEGIIDIRNLIIEISKRGITVLLASHMLDEVEKVCTDVIILQNGKCLYKGSKLGMKNNKYYIELDSNNNEKLLTLLSKMNFSTSISNRYVIIESNNEINIQIIIENIIKENIIPTHIYSRQNSLEEKFLNITQNS